MIIINENEYAQNCIKNRDYGDNIYTTLAILAKYYYAQGLKKKAVCIELVNFVEIAYPKYSVNKYYWMDVIDNIAKKNAKDNFVLRMISLM